MAKIVYNNCFGGFNLSEKARIRYLELSGKPLPRSHELSRSDPFLVQVVEELGKDANGPHAELCIRDLPSGTRYRIEEYDGAEGVITPDEEEWEVAP